MTWTVPFNNSILTGTVPQQNNSLVQPLLHFSRPVMTAQSTLATLCLGAEYGFLQFCILKLLTIFLCQGLYTTIAVLGHGKLLGQSPVNKE